MPADICVRPWEFAAEPFRILGGLYYVGNTNVSCHLMDTGDGVILLDTAYPQTVYLLLESIRRLGFDPSDIRYILHSHGHYDHFGGTRALVELTGAETFLGQGDLEILESRPELSWAPEYGVEFHEGFHVTHAVKDGDEVRLGKTKVRCLSTPGHTPGTISYFFEIEEGGNVYLAGIHGGPGLNTLSLDYLRRYGLSTNRRLDYMESLARLSKERVDVFIGAHPAQNDTFRRRSAMRAGKNPFIDRRAWGDFLRSLETRAMELSPEQEGG